MLVKDFLKTLNKKDKVFIYREQEEGYFLEYSGSFKETPDSLMKDKISLNWISKSVPYLENTPFASKINTHTVIIEPH